MKNHIIMLTTLLTWSTVPMAGVININDGASHTIDTLRGNDIYLDYETPNDPGTHMNLIDGGSVESLVAWNNSTISMNGGIVASAIKAYDNSTITMENGLVEWRLHVSDNAVATVNGGIIGSFATSGNAVSVFNNGIINNFLSAISNGTATMNGGSVVGYVAALENGTLTITGGSIDGYIDAAIEGIIYLKGTNFEVNGHALSYGDSVRDFAHNPSPDIYVDTITGILSDGSILNNEFQISNTADIIIIPEPGTLFLLGLGGLAIKKQ